MISFGWAIILISISLLIIKWFLEPIIKWFLEPIIKFKFWLEFWLERHFYKKHYKETIEIINTVNDLWCSYNKDEIQIIDRIQKARTEIRSWDLIDFNFLVNINNKIRPYKGIFFRQHLCFYNKIACRHLICWLIFRINLCWEKDKILLQNNPIVDSFRDIWLDWIIEVLVAQPKIEKDFPEIEPLIDKYINFLKSKPKDRFGGLILDSNSQEELLSIQLEFKRIGRIVFRSIGKEPKLNLLEKLPKFIVNYDPS